MKKLFLSSLIFLFFSSSIVIFQLSCSKEAVATTNNTEQKNKIVYAKENAVTELKEIWLANIDGSNQTKVPITVPTNKYFLGEVTITPDGNKLIFQLRDKSTSNIGYIFTSNVDGTNVTQIIGNGDKDIIYYGITAY